MKINNTKNITTKFGDLTSGDVFECDETFYMKTKPTYDCNGDFYNAIILTDGSFETIDDNEYVVCVDCELVVK